MELRRPAADGCLSLAVVQAEHGGSPVRRVVRAAARRPHVRGLRLHAGHLLRRPRWTADAADAPLVRQPVPRRDDDPHAPDLLHRRFSQAARDQLVDRSRAAPVQHPRGVCRILAPGRLAVRHRPADRRRHHAIGSGRRHLHLVLRLRWGVPGRRLGATAVHRARAAHPRPARRVDHCPHAAVGVPEAHAVARSWPPQRQRRRLPVAARVRRKGRWLLLHRLRRHGIDGCTHADQPDLDVRTLRPVEGDSRRATRLVHGMAGGRPTHHAQLGDPSLGLHGRRGTSWCPAWS